MFDRLETARAAVQAVYDAHDETRMRNLYEDGALGVTHAAQAWHRLDDACREALEALELVPNIGEAVARWNQVFGYDLCDDTRGHLERLLVRREVHLLLDDVVTWEPETLSDIP